MHAWWEDACAVWLHNFTILGWAALGEAAKTMEKLTNKTVDRQYLGDYDKQGAKLKPLVFLI